MEDGECREEEHGLDLIDWDELFNGLPQGSPPLAADSVSSWIGQVENLLMNDDDYPSDHFSDEFLADIRVASPAAAAAASTDKDCSSASSEMDHKVEEKVVDIENKDGQDPDDNPLSKKRRRQLRNRDAAVRSRERKKMYVRDLEIKSRYLEGECRRLGRLLQCLFAENHALRLSLHNHNANAPGVTSAMQESAVLFLESLLLGSLLWFLGIMCIFTLPAITLAAIRVKNVEEEAPGRGLGSEVFAWWVIQSGGGGRRCKALRTRIKPSFLKAINS